MKAIFTSLALLALLSGSLAASHANLPAAAHNSTWRDLFVFPFLDVPVQLMFGIACPSMKACFIAGGNTNSAFGIYKTGPLPHNFSTVTKCQVNTPDPAIFLLSIAFEDENKGIVGGVGIGVGGTYYTDNGQNFTESLDFGVISTQAVYSMGNNHFAFIGQESKHTGAAVSVDGGVHFQGQWWPQGFSADAPPRYGAFPSKEVFYISGGTWPQQPNDTSSESPEDFIELSHKLRFNRKTNKYDFKEISKDRLSKVGDDSNYTAVIAKSTDAGASWKVIFHSVGDYYFNNIDCFNETLCMAVAEGFAADGGKGGCHVLQTTDGSNWTEIYTYGAEKGGSCMDVKMLSATEAWVGSTFAISQFKAGAEFSHTVDGGKTWTTEPTLHEVGIITQMSFIDDAHAYAVGVTTMQISTALQFAPSIKSGEATLKQVEAKID